MNGHKRRHQNLVIQPGQNRLRGSRGTRFHRDSKGILMRPRRIHGVLRIIVPFFEDLKNAILNKSRRAEAQPRSGDMIIDEGSKDSPNPVGVK